MKKKIVVSAINLREGGTLSILKSCINYLAKNMAEDYTIIALVHDKNLINIPNIIYYEFSDSKKSWSKRLYYEYIYFQKFSLQLKPYLWLSLHDITPNVKAEILATYCHNASTFYRLTLKEALTEPKFALFNLFYKYLYKINISKNDFVIVQQDWMRTEFKKIFNIYNVVVAYPNIKMDKNCIKRVESTKKVKFIYPSLARIFKNFEVICEASKILNDRGINNFEVYLTITGNDTKYSKYIYYNYKKIESLKFIGFQPEERLLEYYNEADCLIFPSKLETWGVPITEFKSFNKPILLADLRYAHETIGDYDKVKFFNPYNPNELSKIMKEFINGKLAFEQTKQKDIGKPFAKNWEELFNILLKKKDN